MLTKTQIEYLKKLSRKKYRNEYKEFLVEGKRLVEEGLRSNYNCVKLIITEDFHRKESLFIEKYSLLKTNIFSVSDNDFKKFSLTKTPQGIAAVFSIPEPSENYTSNDLVICLENISDPGNIGTILRTCDWFGLKNVILSEDCVDIFNPKVTRASMGAIFNVNVIHSTDVIKSLLKLKRDGYELFIADMDGKDYREFSLNIKTVIVFSNEASGPSKELKNIADYIITIPQKGSVESLNVAAAAAVIISKFTS